VAEVVGQLGLQRGLKDPAGQPGQKAAGAGQLLRAQALSGLVEGPLGQQLAKTVCDLLLRSLDVIERPARGAAWTAWNSW